MQKGGDGSALLIGAALALYRKGRDKGVTWTGLGSFGKRKTSQKRNRNWIENRCFSGRELLKTGWAD